MGTRIVGGFGTSIVGRLGKEMVVVGPGKGYLMGFGAKNWSGFDGEKV